MYQIEVYGSIQDGLKIMDEIVNIEQEKARRYTEKFNSFKATYAAQNPPPPYPKIDRWDWLETVGLVALVVASIIVSGSRTIPEFGGGVVRDPDMK